MNEIGSDMLAGEEFPPRQIGIDITNVMVEDREPRAEKESGCAFREVPALILAFHRKQVGTRAHNTCLGCSKLHKTNQLERLAGHVRRCNELDPENGSAILEAYDRYMLFKKKSDKNTERNNDWVDVMVENNFSLASVGSKSFKRFMRENIPDWNIASRHQISDQYIPRMSKKIQTEFEASLKTLTNLYLSVEFDHWKDSNRRSLLGIVITMKGKQHFQDLIDASTVGHSSRVIVEQLKLSLKTIPKGQINAVVSDSASACTLARQLLVADKEFNYTIQHRCMAHLLNRLGSRISSSVKDLVDWALTIQAFASAHPQISARLKRENLKKIQKHCVVRWYSTVNMFETLLEAKSVILDELRRCKTADQMISFADETYWGSLEEAISIYRPLADCIAQAEREDGSMGECFRAILKFGYFILSIRNNASPLVSAAIESFLLYISESKLGRDEFGLYFASYLLDRRFHRTFLTEDSIDLALRCIIQIARKSNITAGTVEAALIPEFNSYLNKKGTYSEAPSNQTTAFSYWSTKHNASPLRCVSLRLASLRSSSANIERIFSKLRHAQTLPRTNLAITTMRDLVRMRINGRADAYDGEEDIDQPQTDDQDASSSLLSSPGSSSNENTSQTLVSSLGEQTEPNAPLDEAGMRLLRQLESMVDFSFKSDDQGSLSPTLSADSIDESDVDRLVRAARENRGAA